MNQTWVNILPDHPYSGYLSLPPLGSGPGLILLQEIWGVNSHIQAIADSYAQAGFVVLAPDIFWRLTPRLNLEYDKKGSQKAFECLQTLDKTRAVEDTVQAIEFLKSHPQVNGKTGVIGFCLGGQLAYRSAAAGNVDAAICYYGGQIASHLDVADQLSCPVIFHHGTKDTHIPNGDVEQVKQTFANRSNAQFFDYETGHGFNCWGRPSMYDLNSAVLAQGRTLTFLAETLCI
ncbi:MAG: Carboxymethylenebutenolidase [Candidatus Celerinatantimonas neptuna]|nr:MAG: Carboxymethylenebutenolidase [Candidatus Celerinatantimonas neptuna]